MDKLKEIGLNEYEVKAYMALIRYGTQTGKDVAKHSEVPPTRVFDTLRSLADKGLVSIVKEKPMLFKAIEPEDGVKTLFEKKIDSLKSLEKEVISSLKEVERKPIEKPKIEEKVTVLLGFQKMYEYSLKKIEKAEKQVLIFSVGEEIPYSMKIAIRRLTKRVSDVRFIATKYDEENMHVLKEFSTFGWKMKHYPSTGEYTFMVTDKKIVMINVRDPNRPEDRISIFFENPELAKSLAEYFDALWNKSKVIKL